MAVNITPSSGSATPEFLRSARGIEIVKLVGVATAAADTSTAYISRLGAPSIVIDGAFTVVCTGNSCVFTSRIALGSNTVYVILAEAA